MHPGKELTFLFFPLLPHPLSHYRRLANPSSLTISIERAVVLQTNFSLILAV